MENKVVLVDMINVYYSASFLRPLKPVLPDKIQISSVLARNDTHTLTLAPQAFSLESWVSGGSSRSDITYSTIIILLKDGIEERDTCPDEAVIDVNMDRDYLVDGGVTCIIFM